MKSSLLSVPQVARICSLSRGTIWKYARSGDLKASMTPGGHYRIHKADLEAFILRKKIHPPAGHEPGKPRILVVDDDPQIRNMLVVMLSRNGKMVAVAEDGFEAGVKVMSFKPNLIILDLFMPKMDGFEVCKRIKEDQATFHIRVLAVTGYDSPENRDKTLAMGADGYMVKPFDGKTLLKSVNALLERSAGTGTV